MTDDATIAPGGASNEENKEKKTGQTPPRLDAAVPVHEQPSQDTHPNKDIQSVLESVKLPERHEFKAAADVPKTPVPESEAHVLEEHIVKAVEKNAREATSPQSAAPAMPAASPPELASSLVVPVRTLKDDLQTIVREQKISLVHAVSLEEEKKKGQEHLAPEQQEIRSRGRRRTFGILFASGLFIVLGIAALAGVLFVIQQQQAIPTAPQSSLLFAEQTVTFALDNQTSRDLKSELARARTQNLGSLGSILRVIPTINSTATGSAPRVQPATLAQFFSALGITPPEGLMSAVGSQFFFGFYALGTNEPLFVIPVSSYDHAFAGMLAWEPMMNAQLQPVFTAVPATILGPTGLPQPRTFVDDVLRNYDVRELKDDSGNTVLYYSFPTPNLLIIAESPYEFGEILSRLQAAREL